jgi:hypothetical protein
VAGAQDPPAHREQWASQSIELVLQGEQLSTLGESAERISALVGPQLIEHGIREDAAVCAFDRLEQMQQHTMLVSEPEHQ